MATRQRARQSSDWDLSGGMDVDYSGTAEIAASDKLFQNAQGIIDKAYDLDREGETQQSRIDLANAENIDKLTTLQAKSELEKALATESYVTEEVTPAKQGETEYRDPPNGYIDGEGNQIDPREMSEADKQAQRVAVTKEKTPAITATRPLTQLEKLRAAVPKLTTSRARLAAQEAIRKEITSEAYQLHASQPDKALEVLRQNGLGVATVLQRRGRNFVQRLDDGREIELSQLDASAMVGDIIKGTNDYHKTMMQRSKEAAQQARDDARYESQEARADSRNERDLVVARLQAQARVGSGKYGRSASYDEYGNLVVGGGLGGGGGAVSRQSGAINQITGQPRGTSVNSVDLSKASDDELKATYQGANKILMNDPNNQKAIFAKNSLEAEIKRRSGASAPAAVAAQGKVPNASTDFEYDSTMKQLNKSKDDIAAIEGDLRRATGTLSGKSFTDEDRKKISAALDLAKKERDAQKKKIDMMETGLTPVFNRKEVSVNRLSRSYD